VTHVLILACIIHKKQTNLYNTMFINALKQVLKKTHFCLLFTSAFSSGHLLRCESLEIEHYVCGFRRLASDLHKMPE